MNTFIYIPVLFLLSRFNIRIMMKLMQWPHARFRGDRHINHLAAHKFSSKKKKQNDNQSVDVRDANVMGKSVME